MNEQPRHHQTCLGGDLKYRVDRGGTRRTQCRGCGAAWLTPDDVADVPITTARLVCREHHGEAVNFRGKGCTQCATARKDWRDRRRGRRVVVE
jgi:hypothetical protein